MTPIVFGLASELFITLCRITPAQASPIPAKTPAIIRGSLIIKYKECFTEEESFPVNTLKTSCGFIYTLPDRILKNIIKTSITASKINILVFFFLVHIKLSINT